MESIGKPCPPDVNPADHLIDILAPPPVTEENNGSHYENMLESETKIMKVPINLNMGLENSFLIQRDGKSNINFQRHSKNIYSNKYK